MNNVKFMFMFCVCVLCSKEKGKSQNDKCNVTVSESLPSVSALVVADVVLGRHLVLGCFQFLAGTNFLSHSKCTL